MTDREALSREQPRGPPPAGVAGRCNAPRLALAGSCAFYLRATGNMLGQPIDVDNMGIEIVREPFFEFVMPLVAGISAAVLLLLR